VLKKTSFESFKKLAHKTADRNRKAQHNCSLPYSTN